MAWFFSFFLGGGVFFLLPTLIYGLIIITKKFNVNIPPVSISEGSSVSSPLCSIVLRRFKFNINLFIFIKIKYFFIIAYRFHSFYIDGFFPLFKRRSQIQQNFGMVERIMPNFAILQIFCIQLFMKKMSMAKNRA